MDIKFLGFDKLLETLPMMGSGMLGIFIVIGIIMLSVIILNKINK